MLVAARQLCGAILLASLLLASSAAAHRQGQVKPTAYLRTAIRIIKALDGGRLGGAAAVAAARRLVSRSRTQEKLAVNERELGVLSADLDGLYAQSNDLQRTHKLLSQAGLIGRLRELGMDSGRGREGPFGNAIKEPLPAIGYKPTAVKKGISVDGRFVAAPIRPLGIRMTYHWTTDSGSSRRVQRQGFSISNVPSVNEGGRGVYVGMEPEFWKVMGSALLRVSLDPRARSVDFHDRKARAFYTSWAGQRRLDSGEASTLERFCREFGVDVLRMGNEACVVKSGQAIRAVHGVRAVP